MKSRFIQILIFLSLTTFFSCGKSRFKPDSNLENLALQIERIDRKIIALDSSQLLSELVSLSEEHPEFYRDYLSIWDLNPEDTTQVCELFRDFLADSLQAQVHADVLKTFDNVSGLERKLSKAFSYLHYYFPQIKLPRVYFFVGGFNRSIMTGSDFVAIGADLYLGRDYAPYKNLTYDYLVYNMDPESIPVDVLSVILAPAFPFHSGKNRLIDNMLYHRDLGIMLHLQPTENSALHFLSLQGGLFSGNAINIDTDNYKDLIARLEANKTNPYFSYSGGISYYLGGVYQGSPVVYSMQEKSFVAHIDPENKGKFALREYLGADVQLEFKNPFGRTCLIGEYIFGLQPASISSSKSPDANELPSHDTYLRDFTGAYVMLTQDIGKTPLTAVLKYDVYDPNRHVAGDEVGMKNTNKTDLEQRALGFGLLWAASSRIRLTAYYELNNYEHTSSMPLINDLKQDVFSLRLLCKF